MAHPFSKFFEQALKKSLDDENLVLKEAIKLKNRGYPPNEIHRVLKELGQGRIDDDETETIREALEAFSQYTDK